MFPARSSVEAFYQATSEEKSRGRSAMITGPGRASGRARHGCSARGGSSSHCAANLRVAPQGIRLLGRGGEIHHGLRAFPAVPVLSASLIIVMPEVVVRLRKQLQQAAVPRLLLGQKRPDARPGGLQPVKQPQVVALRREIVAPLVEAVPQRVQQVDGPAGCGRELRLRGVLVFRVRLPRGKGRKVFVPAGIRGGVLRRGELCSADLKSFLAYWM